MPSMSLVLLMYLVVINGSSAFLCFLYMPVSSALLYGKLNSDIIADINVRSS